MKDGRHVTQALLYYPYEEMASLCVAARQETSGLARHIERATDALCRNLLSRQVDFDFINRDLLLEYSFEEGKIFTPCGETPSILIFPPVTFVDGSVARALRGAVEAGVRVLFDGERREIGGLNDLTGVEFIRDAGLPASEDFIVEDEPLLTVYHRAGERQQVYLLVNTGESEICREASIPDQGGGLLWLDPDAGRAEAVIPTGRDGRLRFPVRIPPLAARVLVQEAASAAG